MSQATSEHPEPILASWKISEVLGRYPVLLEELANLNPAFRQLRNPLLRRVQARLVTVAQAAEMAGLEPAELVRALNTAVGASVREDAPQRATDAPAAAPDWIDRAEVAVEFDARPLLARGEEPFAAIVRAAQGVPAGQVLQLRAPFDPLPLYDVLAGRGFAGWGRQIGERDWEVFFRNEGRPVRQPKAAPAAAPDPDWDAPTAVVTIDVSELVPPEPLVKILETLADLPAGGTLRVHHVRRPIHLYARLDEMGYPHETREPAPGRVELLIQKPAVSREALA
ncbi:MAG TPA: DUF2249 domain-containing protein [Thermomicrobiaceae bacterium]|jgi:uncharacterized protein (DUF2249 family)|nr:DUF2249 domain-containing protein [Thermomicrobiaceae bacterium]